MDEIDWNELNSVGVMVLVSLHALFCGYLIISKDKFNDKRQ